MTETAAAMTRPTLLFLDREVTEYAAPKGVIGALNSDTGQ